MMEKDAFPVITVFVRGEGKTEEENTILLT
jgi:hypothetical protein